MCSPERYASDLASITRHARDAGRGERPFATAAFLFSVLDGSVEAAHRRAVDELERLYQRPFADAARRYCLLGRAEDCLERMRQFARVGVRHFILAPLGDLDAFASRAASEILPEVPALLR
jgi:alkanesulfonate monooxygenase SsuD/methylene tetrahydromethanopterin reductase-like flavin-dependent oxidoreductase (luciferase family)